MFEKEKLEYFMAGGAVTTDPVTEINLTDMDEADYYLIDFENANRIIERLKNVRKRIVQDRRPQELIS